MKITKTSVLYTAAAATLIAPIIAGTDAQARKRGNSSYYYEKTFRTTHPERGYEGHISVGPVSAYCSYRREPNRKCHLTRSGRERCQVVSWKLVQHCY